MSGRDNSPDDFAKLRRSPGAMAAWQNALRDIQNGRHAEARAGFQKLVEQFPGAAQLWAELGIAAAGELDFTSADRAYQRALELAPGDSSLLAAIGEQYYHLRRLDQTVACFERAVAANPGSVPLRLALASWLERFRRVDEALDCIEACLAQNPKCGEALYFKAFLLHRTGKNTEAETLLRDLLKDTALLSLAVQADSRHLLGVILDDAGQYAEALQSLSESKSLRSRTLNLAAYDQAADAAAQARAKMISEMNHETIRRWRDEAADSPCPHRLALLGGAMRSGTTLIEQILGAHPQIVVIDESMNSLQELIKPAANDRSQTIARYFKSMLRELAEEPAGRLLLDKNPSTTAWLHVWLPLFPPSKIIIALRDPRDVIVSCYFQNFPKDWSIAAFSTFERTARFYSANMDLWLRLRTLGGFDWVESRYEDVVANLETEGRRVTEFLGLQWHEAQANFHETARRKFVHSPSYNEVAKPVNKKPVGRWQNYAEALAPLQPALQPYRKAFGYS